MRTTIGSLRFYSERIVCSEDLPFQLVMILKSNRVTYIPEAMYYYCLNGCSLSNTFDFEKCFRYFTLAKIIKEYYTQEQEYHIWRFFFTSCQNFLRGLVLSDIPRKEKCKWLMQLCGNNEIVSYLKEYKYWFGKKPHSHLFAQYHYFITHGNVMLLYLTASIDQYVICDKLGLKKQQIHDNKSFFTPIKKIWRYISSTETFYAEMAVSAGVHCHKYQDLL